MKQSTDMKYQITVENARKEIIEQQSAETLQEAKKIKRQMMKSNNLKSVGRGIVGNASATGDEPSRLFTNF